MLESSLDIVKLLIGWGIYGFILLLPISLGVPIGGYLWLKSKFKHGACEGSVRHCVSEQNKIIMKESRLQIDTVKNQITESYKQDLDKWIESNPNKYSHEHVEQCKIMYGVIMDGSFLYMERKLDDMVSNNHWPKSSSKNFNKWANKVFENIWSETWKYFDNAFEAFLILTIDSRRARNKDGKEEMRQLFIELLLFSENVKLKY